MPHNTNDTDSTDNPATPAKIDVTKLFQEHQRHLARFVKRYIRNPDDAEDLVQSTFVEALRCADTFSGMSKPSTWLFGIARNLARNHIRRGYAFDTLDEPEIENLVDPAGDPETYLEMRQVSERIDALLNALPEKIRTTFEAVVDGDSTYEEVAEKLNVPIGTVRSRVSRVRAAVRDQVS